MFVSYLSPLAPAAVLLLGVFILLMGFPRLPARWQGHRLLRYLGPPALVGLAILTLLGTRLTLGRDAAGQGLEMLSGWNFSTAESVATLSVRVDILDFFFLILTLLILLAATLAYAPFSAFIEDKKKRADVAIWLAMAAVSCLLFVSANGLTMGYALLAFDLLTAFYWLRRGAVDLGVARLFLAVFTTSSLALVTITPTAGILLFGLALCLRLGFYPVVEMGSQAGGNEDDGLVYLSLSLAVGFYLVIRVLVAPMPGLIQGVVMVTLLLTGLLAWLSEHHSSWLIGLALTKANLILLAVGPMSEELIIVYALGLILSLVALWLTPSLGKPEFNERGWLWPYLPAVGATWTLIGFPLSLGWSMRVAVYQSFFFLENTLIVILAVLAEALALSGLVGYWRRLGQNREEQNERRAAAGIVSMVPFLIPGLAPFIVSVITRTDTPLVELTQPLSIGITLAIIIAGAFGLDYFRSDIKSLSGLSAASRPESVLIPGLLLGAEKYLNRMGKLILRIEVFLEGQHYIGWALFTALVGILVILLGV